MLQQREFSSMLRGCAHAYDTMNAAGSGSFYSLFARHESARGPGQLRCADASAEESPEIEGDADDSLEDVARGERDYVRERLHADLDREPTDEEVDEWLQQHTEGY